MAMRSVFRPILSYNPINKKKGNIIRFVFCFILQEELGLLYDKVICQIGGGIMMGMFH